jgi:hypothetical protein
MTSYRYRGRYRRSDGQRFALAVDPVTLASASCLRHWRRADLKVNTTTTVTSSHSGSSGGRGRGSGESAAASSNSARPQPLQRRLDRREKNVLEINSYDYGDKLKANVSIRQYTSISV